MQHPCKVHAVTHMRTTFMQHACDIQRAYRVHATQVEDELSFLISAINWLLIVDVKSPPISFPDSTKLNRRTFEPKSPAPHKATFAYLTSMQQNKHYVQSFINTPEAQKVCYDYKEPGYFQSRAQIL